MESRAAINPAPVLAVKDLTRTFGVRTVVDHVSFSLTAGEIVGLVGLNGAGKTTIINMILGVLTPTAGSVVIDGLDIATAREAALARTNFSAVYAPLPGNLTVTQNLRIFGLFYDVPDLTRRIEDMIELFDLSRFRHTRCGLLSSGEQTRVSLAKALLNRPDVLLLDEPTASLDPDTADWVRGRLEKYRAERNATILLASHNMNEVERLCDRVIIMKKGRIEGDDTPERLLAHYGRVTLEEVFLDVARGTSAEAAR